jgi:hypothetical protein
LVSLIAGEAQCHYAAWFKGHHTYDKLPKDLAAWQLEHTDLVRATAQALQADGWTTTLEDQNGFRLTGQTAVLAGKPDIVARKEGRLRVVDCKTGQPNHKDLVQVATYLLALPLAWKRTGLLVEGELVYKTHTVPVTQEEAATTVKDRLFTLIRGLATATTAPPTVPSERECAWCDIAACPDRFTPETAETQHAETVLF